MRKSQIQIKSPASSPLILLGKLEPSDVFVDNYKSLHVVVSPRDQRVGELIQCVRLGPGPARGVCTFRCGDLVQQVDIKLEWSYYEKASLSDPTTD
jgi:hypothetical protein